MSASDAALSAWASPASTRASVGDVADAGDLSASGESALPECSASSAAVSTTGAGFGSLSGAGACSEAGASNQPSSASSSAWFSTILGLSSDPSGGYFHL